MSTVTGFAFGMGCHCCGGTGCSPCDMPDSGITVSADFPLVTYPDTYTVSFSLAKSSGTLTMYNNMSGNIFQQGSPYWFIRDDPTMHMDVWVLCGSGGVGSLYCLFVIPISGTPPLEFHAYTSFTSSGGDVTFYVNQQLVQFGPFSGFTPVTCSPLNVHSPYPDNGQGMCTNCQITE